MPYPDRVMTSTRPRLVVLKGASALEPGQVESLRTTFDVVEAFTVHAARKLLDGSVGGFVLCSPETLTALGDDSASPSSVPGTPAVSAAFIQNLGDGIGAVDAAGALLWSDPRLKNAPESVKAEFTRIGRQTLEDFNRFTDAATRDRTARRFRFTAGDSHFELAVSPGSIDQALGGRVMSVVGVLWNVTRAVSVQKRLAAVEAAGAELLRIDAATLCRMNMAERLKHLEQGIVRAAREVLQFDNFEVRLVDRESNLLELVITQNIAPLKIGEVLSASAEENGISGYVATTGRSYNCPDVKDDPLYREGLENAASSLTVPLRFNDRVIGTLNVESTRPEEFDEDDRRCAEIFAGHIAAALNTLELLIIERYTTSQQIIKNVVGEINQPLSDLTARAKALREANLGNVALSGELDAILEAVARLHGSVAACAAGPQTILGVEQELQRHEADPLVAGRHILVADDEPAIRDTLNSILTQKGARVTVCGSGGQTIDTLQSSQAAGLTYDLVISDIKMPDRNGYEVYRTAKAINAGTPVILMTGFGYDPHHCIVRASQEGLQSFLFKPFRASQLMEVISKSLAPR